MNFSTPTFYILVLTSLLAACGDDDGPGSLDIGTADGGTDTGFDVGTDGGTDGGPQCIDLDDDGYGDGCALGMDCNDDDDAVSPAAVEMCNGVDDDCDSATDEDLPAPSCALTEGVCIGALERCGAEGFMDCDAMDYGAGYEADEVSCDGMDNDCDGTTDEGCTCEAGTTQTCGIDTGACMTGTQSCVAGSFGSCEGEVEPMGESCNGLDDDCDGMMDEPGDLVAPNCPLQRGVCSGSKRACGGASGWIACSGVGSYGGDYQGTESLCDGLDNDCDGVTDEGCECIDGETQACGTSVGMCMAGIQTCTSGAFGGCAGEVAPTMESCDGDDDDCDGATDEDVVGPDCTLSMGVCAGRTQRCTGASGFVACTAADYGARYQATETRCDGVDNDCDGTVDEGCDCIDGATQACGSSTGACTRGMQTCMAGSFGACVGGTGPAAEICNGLDDDCDGVTDDNLIAPSCALTMGVCMGTTQVCGGAAGWEACSGTDSYGASYVVSEDGATREGECDGLDNDCDGTIDDGCTSIPVIITGDDVVFPDLHNDHLVYMQNFDGNWDIVFQRMGAAVGTRLTTTAVSEFDPKVYGNFVTYVRGEDAAARVVLYDLNLGRETVITTRPSGSPDLYSNFLVYDEFDGIQSDVMFYDIADGTSSPLLEGADTTNEIRPSVRGTTFSWLSGASGRFLVNVVDLGAAMPTVVVQTPAAMSATGQLIVVMDYAALAWTDGRNATAPMPSPTSNLDVYGALLNGTGADVFPGERSLATGAAAQTVTDMDGGFVVYTDYQSANADVGIVGYGGTATRLTTHPGTQAEPTISGDLVLWGDNRRGGFDIYGTALRALTSLGTATTAGDLVVDELLADPAADADVNGDGTASTTQDEFVELVNATGIALDISGVTLSDAVSVRHTFAPGTVIPALGSIVVFGGGTPTGLFGGAQLVVASTGTLGLNNTGDTVTVTAPGGVVLNTVTYGSAGGNDESLHRSPALTGALTRTSMITGSVGAYSPGTDVRGFPY